MFNKSSSQRGEERGGRYLARIATGKKDSDGSPTYRYIRSVKELEAYKKTHKDTKETHEKQKKEHDKIKKETKEHDQDNKKDKEKEDKKKLYILDTERQKKDYSKSKKDEKVKKGLYVL